MDQPRGPNSGRELWNFCSTLRKKSGPKRGGPPCAVVEIHGNSKKFIDSHYNAQAVGLPAGSGSLRSFREPRRSSEILPNPPEINKILLKSSRSSLRAGSETRRSLLGSSASQEVPKPGKPTKNHGERSTKPTSHHLKKLFCITLEWFQVVSHTLVSPF